MTIRVKLVIMIRIAGASDSTVSRMTICIADGKILALGEIGKLESRWQGGRRAAGGRRRGRSPARVNALGGRRTDRRQISPVPREPAVPINRSATATSQHHLQPDDESIHSHRASCLLVSDGTVLLPPHACIAIRRALPHRISPLPRSGQLLQIAWKLHGGSSRTQSRKLDQLVVARRSGSILVSASHVDRSSAARSSDAGSSSSSLKYRCLAGSKQRAERLGGGHGFLVLASCPTSARHLVGIGDLAKRIHLRAAVADHDHAAGPRAQHHLLLGRNRRAGKHLHARVDSRRAVAGGKSFARTSVSRRISAMTIASAASNARIIHSRRGATIGGADGDTESVREAWRIGCDSPARCWRDAIACDRRLRPAAFGRTLAVTTETVRRRARQRTRHARSEGATQNAGRRRENSGVRMGSRFTAPLPSRRRRSH